MAEIRELIADELERQIMEDFRNPLVKYPDLGEPIPRKQMLERADAILNIVQKGNES